MIERDRMNRLFGTATGNDFVAVSHAGCRVCRTKPALTFLHCSWRHGMLLVAVGEAGSSFVIKALTFYFLQRTICIPHNFYDSEP